MEIAQIATVLHQFIRVANSRVFVQRALGRNVDLRIDHGWYRGVLAYIFRMAAATAVA